MSVEITWNDVNDKMPKKSAWYLVTYGENGVGEAYYDKKSKKWLTREMDFALETVIAWAEMPKPFKK